MKGQVESLEWNSSHSYVRPVYFGQELRHIVLLDTKILNRKLATNYVT